jgi:DNA-binding NarL/FixJ family response regulator
MSGPASAGPMVEILRNVTLIHACTKETEIVKTTRVKFVGHGCESPSPEELAAPSLDPNLGPLREQLDRAAMRRRLLTPRQLEVVSLVAEGINNKEIATPLGIGEEGVKKHVAAVMRKVNVDRRTKLARWFLGL